MRTFLYCLSVSLLATISLPVFAQSAAKAGVQAGLWRGDPLAGRQKSDDERCQECHGHDGNAQDIEDGVGNIGKFPRLAGQSSDYLLKQLRDFRSGARHNETMLIMARSLNEHDAADIVAFFSSQATAGEKGTNSPQGRRLYIEGDAARGIAPCVMDVDARQRPDVALLVKALLYSIDPFAGRDEDTEALAS